MPQITHRKDPAGIAKPQTFDVDNETNIIDWLNENYGDQSNLCGDLACDFYLNGKLIFSNDKEQDDSALNVSISGMDSLLIVNRPSGVDPVSIAIIAAVSIVASVGAALLLKPKIPSTSVGSADNTQTESPNNKLNAAQNSFRPRQAIPECFGYGVSYPDFIQPSYYYYDNDNKKIQVGVFVVTVGSIAANPEIRVGETNINSITNSNADLYGPGQSIPAQYLKIHEKSTGFDGQTLLAPNDDSIQNNGWVGWFDLPTKRAQQVQFNIIYPQGVRNVNDDGNVETISLQISLQIQRLNDNDQPIYTAEKVFTITSNDLDPQYKTVTFAPSNTPGMAVGRYRARAKRLTNIINARGNAAEKIVVETVFSISEPYSDSRFGDCTKLVVIRKATLNSADQSATKINLDYRRLLPFYNRTTGQVETNNLVATDSFADAAVYTLMKGGETESTIDLDGIYDIYDGLSDSRLGGFTFTFDDADVSMAERVDTICNSARVFASRNGEGWRFVRDEVKQIRSALFNRRSLVGNSSRQSFTPQRKDDPDSVRIVFIDPTNNTEAFIKRRFDLNTLQIIDNEVGASVKEINLYGCQDSFQASNRADVEIRRLAYQRRTVTDTTYQEALYLDLMDRVGWVDINDSDVFDGEILAIDGFNYYTSERFLPAPGEDYFVFITDSEGYPSNTVTCTALESTDFGFRAGGIIGDVYVADQVDSQIGSRYFIANAADNLASNFLLASRTPNSDGTVDINMIEYNANIYENDDLQIVEGAAIVPLNISDIAYAPSGSTATATITINRDGTISTTESLFTWYSEGLVAGIGDQFELFVSVDGDSLSSGTVGQWIDLSSDRTYQISLSSMGVASSTINVTIREKARTYNSSSNDMTLLCVVDEIVALPPSILDSNTVKTTATSLISFNPDGTWETQDGSTGTWITQAPMIGELYELRATNLTGNVDGAFNTWLSLSDAERFTLVSSVGELSTFDVEIRSINEPTNTDTTQVTLYAVTPATMTQGGNIDVIVEDETNTPVIASFTVELNGDFSTSLGNFEAYTDTVDPIGERYEVRANNLTGDTPTGTFDAWIDVDADIQWLLSTETSASCTFDVEVREKYNPTNSATASILLSAEYTGP